MKMRGFARWVVGGDARDSSVPQTSMLFSHPLATDLLEMPGRTEYWSLFTDL